MSSRTNLRNAYESDITGTLLSGQSTVGVTSAAGLTEPVYLVIDPDVPAKREWIRVDTIAGNTFSNITRNLTGSVGDVDHDVGAVVRMVVAQQHIEDLFTDVEANEAGISTLTSDLANTDSAAATHAATVDVHHARYTDAEAQAAIATEDLYYTKAEVDALLASYYTRAGDPQAVAGRTIYVEDDTPGPTMVNGDIWLDTTP